VQSPVKNLPLPVPGQPAQPAFASRTLQNVVTQAVGTRAASSTLQNVVTQAVGTRAALPVPQQQVQLQSFALPMPQPQVQYVQQVRTESIIEKIAVTSQSQRTEKSFDIWRARSPL
jgi:hypothetical protein